jgi:hypothetical protein
MDLSQLGEDVFQGVKVVGYGAEKADSIGVSGDHC